MSTLAKCWEMKIGKHEYERVLRWAEWTSNSYGHVRPWQEQARLSLLALDGQGVEPNTALFIILWFGLDSCDVPSMNLADANYCDSLSCQLEQRLGLRMSYNYENRQLHISRTDNPRTTLERIKHRLESVPHLWQQWSTDYDPITGSWVTIAVSTMPHQKA